MTMGEQLPAIAVRHLEIRNDQRGMFFAEDRLGG